MKGLRIWFLFCAFALLLNFIGLYFAGERFLAAIYGIKAPNSHQARVSAVAFLFYAVVYTLSARDLKNRALY